MLSARSLAVSIQGTSCVLLLLLCGCMAGRGFPPWKTNSDTTYQDLEMGRSISQLQSQLEGAQDAPELNVALGTLFLESGQLLPAMRQVQLALQQESKLVSAWILRGDIEMAKLKYSDSLASYQHAIRLDPSNPELLESVARCYLKQGRPVRAAATLETLMQQYGEAEPPLGVLMLYGSVMRKVGQYSQASYAYARVCEHEDADLESFRKLSEIQLLAGEDEAANETLQIANARFSPQAPASEGFRQAMSTPTFRR